MKLKVLVLGLAVLGFSAGSVFAEDGKGAMKEKPSRPAETENADKYCPICGPEEEMHGLAFSYKHEGKKYSFCSMGCLKAFKENPEKFIKK